MTASRRLAAFALLVLSPLMVACGTSDSGPGDASSTADATLETEAADGTCTYPSDSVGEVPREVDAPDPEPTVSGEVPIVLTLGDGQSLDLELDADAAPCTVNSFVSLAEQGYYDGTTCHRLTVAPASILVLQCGDPTGTGTGGPGYTIPDELEQTTGYPAGTVAMAKRAAPDSGGSQFFLVYGATELPPDYTVFGTLTPASLATLESLVAGGTSNGQPDGAPATPIDIVSAGVA